MADATSHSILDSMSDSDPDYNSEDDSDYDPDDDLSAFEEDMNLPEEYEVGRDQEHFFRGGGIMRRPHHLTSPLDSEQRLEPAPIPKEPEEYEFLTITPLPPRDDSFVMPTVKSTDPEETLAESMNRISASEGETTLRMVRVYPADGFAIVRVCRESKYKVVIKGSKADDWVDSRTYDLPDGQPFRMIHTSWRYMQDQHHENTWWLELGHLRLRASERAFWACQHQLQRQGYNGDSNTYQRFDPENQPEPRTADEVYAEILLPVGPDGLPQDKHDRECAICRELPEESGERLVRLKCQGRHIIGENCIRSWMKPDETSYCPYCREKFVLLPEIPPPPATPTWMLAEQRLEELDRENIVEPAPLTVDKAFMLRCMEALVAIARSCANAPGYYGHLPLPYKITDPPSGYAPVAYNESKLMLTALTEIVRIEDGKVWVPAKLVDFTRMLIEVRLYMDRNPPYASASTAVIVLRANGDSSLQVNGYLLGTLVIDAQGVLYLRNGLHNDVKVHAPVAPGFRDYMFRFLRRLIVFRRTDLEKAIRILGYL